MVSDAGYGWYLSHVTSLQSMTAVPRRRTSTVADEGTTADILAAGALCWRLHKGQLQVLVIHRPRYDDWSFPKGKLDEGETLPECAVREVSEEVGAKVRLGMPLPVTHYTVKGKPKEVWYWAAEIAQGKPQPDGDETDEVRWVSPAEAREMLSSEGDIIPLEELQRLYESNSLRTVPFIVLRHAKAKPRSTWSRSESERPLAATGKRQAKSVEKLLTAWRPRLLHCSPWKRCAETIAPYVKLHRHKIRYRRSLTEKRARQQPAKTTGRVKKSLELIQPSLICTHRPVLPIVLSELSRWIQQDEVSVALPHEDPYLAPGAIVVGQQAVDRGGEVVSLEIYEPFED